MELELELELGLEREQELELEQVPNFLTKFGVRIWKLSLLQVLEFGRNAISSFGN